MRYISRARHPSRSSRRRARSGTTRFDRTSDASSGGAGFPSSVVAVDDVPLVADDRAGWEDRLRPTRARAERGDARATAAGTRRETDMGWDIRRFAARRALRRGEDASKAKDANEGAMETVF